MTLVVATPIQTERLFVRPIVESDLAALLTDVNSSDEVTALLPYVTWTSAADAEAWLGRMRSLEATGLALQLVVELKATGNPIGTCLLFRFEKGSSRVELGYVLGRAYWRQGLMHEALEGLLACAFGPMGIRRIEAEVDTRNESSARLMRRLGFAMEGVLRQRWVSKGEVKDVEMYALLRDEWLAGKSERRSTP